MKISYNWLKNYIKVDIDVTEIAKILTDIGLEVEGLEQIPHKLLNYSNFLVGEVIEVVKHPNADKLKLTKVNIGQSTPLNIVCGAPNVDVGQKVIVAPIGSVVLINNSPINIKKTEIRGCLSEGMICAEDEIGLGTSHEGIMVLDSKAIAGTKLNDFLGIEEDYIFEIGLTPNRIDAASHYGVARDLAAYLQHRNPVLLEKPCVKYFSANNKKSQFTIEIEDKNACIRYSGLHITGLEVKESPMWLKNYLNAIGQKPINNIVDITNYVLHETGHPLHAFDANMVKGNKVIVKTLNKGYKFTSLDDIERELSENDLMICNAEEPMCIAGVFGGALSGVTNSTTSIFLESACFNPSYVRRTAKYHGLSTDSSFRFERGVDPNATIYTLKRAAILIKEIVGGTIESNIIDVYPEPVKPIATEIAFANIDRIIGQHIDREVIKEILRSLEISIIAEKEKGLLVEIPTYRVDVTREIDIIEEILRIYGYNKICFSDKVLSNLTYTKKPDKEKTISALSEMLVANGFYEIMNNSLSNPNYYKEGFDNKLVKLLNPLSNDLSVMRYNLLYGGLESVSYNINRKNSKLKMFEFGNCYELISPNINKENPISNYKEKFCLGLFITGKDVVDNWLQKGKDSSFYNIKTYVELILAKIGIDITKIKISSSEKTYFKECISYNLKKDEIVVFGLVSENELKKFDIKQEVYFAEFNMNEVLNFLKNKTTTYTEISKYPEVKRDLSMIIDKNISYSELTKTAYRVEPKLLKNINIFDVYEGDNIDKNKKSYALSFTLLDSAKTLTNEEIESCMLKISNEFEKEFNAVIRKS